MRDNSEAKTQNTNQTVSNIVAVFQITFSTSRKWQMATEPTEQKKLVTHVYLYDNRRIIKRRTRRLYL